MNEETEVTTEVVTEDTAETESLVTALAPIALIVGVAGAAAYFIRKRLRRDDTKVLSLVPEVIDTTSTEV